MPPDLETSNAPQNAISPKDTVSANQLSTQLSRRSVRLKMKVGIFWANKNLVIMASKKKTAGRLKQSYYEAKSQRARARELELCLPFWLMARNPHDQIGPRSATLAPNQHGQIADLPGVAQSRLRCCIISYNLLAAAPPSRAKTEQSKWKSRLNPRWDHPAISSSIVASSAMAGCQRSNSKLADMQMRNV